MSRKLKWKGKLVSVQPRIRLHRSYDERWHDYSGYVLYVDGEIDGEARSFSVGVGKSVREKHQPSAGDQVEGQCLPVADPRKETAEYYRVSGFRVIERGSGTKEPPPWHGCPPELSVYRERGHRRLDKQTWKTQCRECIWGCLMPVELILDNWNPSKVRYREETFCYGPKSCPRYRAGPTRKVPGRNGQKYEEEDWVDEEAVAHRGPDE